MTSWRKNIGVIKKILSLMCLAVTVTFSHCFCPNCFCPDDIKLGDVRLQNKALFPFRGGEQFTYVNQKGEELIFFDSIKNEMGYLPIVIEKPCAKPELDEQVVFYDGEFFLFEYHMSRSLYLSYRYSISNEMTPASSADTVLYEIFEAQLIDIRRTEPSPTNDFVSSLVSDRGNTLLGETVQNYTNFRIISDTTLYGNNYANVYCQKEKPGMFYCAPYGVVLFQYKNDWWHLKQ